MRLFLLVALTMTAFAANSVLNRVGVFGYGMDAMQFAFVRTLSGAILLWALIAWQGHSLPALANTRRASGALALAVYMIGFSWAYQSLDAGLGALVLFGTLQIAIFGWAARTGAHIAFQRWLGMGTALIGLAVLLWPDGTASVAVEGAFAMAAAALGWAAYTLLGRAETEPTIASAANFVLCTPLVGIAAVLAGGLHPMPLGGAVAAIVAGAVTSGLGYALWYRLVPQLATTTAAIAQLSVPVIAVLGGVILLGEAITPRIGIAGAIVLGGIALSLSPFRRV